MLLCWPFIIAQWRNRNQFSFPFFFVYKWLLCIIVVKNMSYSILFFFRRNNRRSLRTRKGQECWHSTYVVGGVYLPILSDGHASSPSSRRYCSLSRSSHLAARLVTSGVHCIARSHGFNSHFTYICLYYPPSVAQVTAGRNEIYHLDAKMWGDVNSMRARTRLSGPAQRCV